jgi:hypothetical protein
MELEKKRSSRPPTRVPSERRRHSKHDESTPEGDRTPRTDPEELDPCAHRDSCGDPGLGDDDKDPAVND